MRLVLIGVLVLAGCTDSPAARLRAAHPEHAESILADRPTPPGIRMEVLAGGRRFVLDDGFAVTAREVGLQGEAYWTATAIGFEEWLLVDSPASGQPVAAWNIEGGRFRRRGPDVEVVDPEGRARLVVRAPRAYDGAKRIRVRLESQQRLMLLYVDDVAPGRRLLVDPLWKQVSAPSVARDSLTATLLPSGEVLVLGGSSRVAEVYDPVLDTWRDGGTMLQARNLHSATLLSNGKVLVAFGLHANPPGQTLKTSELYDPTAGTFEDAGTWWTAFDHPDLLLPDGRVMVVASRVGFYDPVARAWADGTPPLMPGWQANAQSLTLLPTGKVLVTSGNNPEFDLFDPTTGTWSKAAASHVLTTHHFAGVIAGSRVIKVKADYSEIYDPVGDSWTDAGSPGLFGNQVRRSTVILPDGDALTIGLFGAARYSVDAGTWLDAGELPQPAGFAAATLLASGMVLLVGAINPVAELFDPTFGRACQVASECLTGNCTDGVCCESSCVGACNRCDLPGAPGLCRDLDAGAVGSPGCQPFRCGGGPACSTSCAADSDCAIGFYCSSSLCVAANRLGVPCTTAQQCDAGFCVDGVCCNTACGGGVATDCLTCSSDAGICGNAPASHVCRPPAVACDAPESCTGTAPTCPPDQGLPPGTICRPSAGFCDPAEVCDGFVIPCPADLRAPPTKICRLAAGPCDLDETCDGTSATCPPDVLADAGLVCRPAFGACDAEEACTGSSATCPVNRPAPDGTACIKGGTCEAGDCKPPIPTVKDAGPTMPAVDAGPDPIPTPPRGCGCTSTHGAFALALLVFVRRRRPVQSRPE